MSMSKLPVSVTVMVSSSTARERLSTVMKVLPRLRPRLARAMEKRETPLRLRCALRNTVPSVYLTASTGDTRAAMRPGRRQDMSTVTRAKAAEKTNIQGLTDTTVTTALSWETITGTSRLPTAQPSSSPRGMPAADRLRAWMRMMRFSCLGVVPMVFSSP